MNIKLYDYVINGHDIACYKTTCLINLKWSAVSWKLNVTCSILKIHSGDERVEFDIIFREKIEVPLLDQNPSPL